MKKIIIALAICVIMIAAFGGLFIVNKNKTPPKELMAPLPNRSELKADKEFTLTAKNFSYDMPSITVKKGDVVKIKLINGDTSEEMLHDFVIGDLNIKSKRVYNDETDTITFTAYQVGTFEYYCSVADHRTKGMSGKFIVME